MRVLPFLICFLSLPVFVVGECPDLEDDLQSWADPGTWDNTALPASGSDVLIDKPILLDVKSLTLRHITIVGDGRLVFSDQVGDITITTDGILVQSRGQLIIGSEGCRFQNNVNIRLTGSRTADRSLLDGKGEKFIVVQDAGSLQIYGQEKLAWTKLSGTVNRWQHDENNVVYSHKDSSNFGMNKHNEGLAMYIFSEDTLSPRLYKVFDLDAGGNTKREQKQVDKLVNALDGVVDGEIVALAMQHKYSTTADQETLFTTLESLSGIPRVALRDLQMKEAYSLVFQKGGSSKEAYDNRSGKQGKEARANIVLNGKKITAISVIKDARSKNMVDFRIMDLSVGFPTISVIDDVSSWHVGDEIILTSTDYSGSHTEKTTIKETTDENTIVLANELDYRHFGEIEDGVDMRGEVALLTRNIKIGGVMSPGCPEENENCKEFKHDTYGAHTKIMGFSSVHIEGVEFVNVGQTTDTGFYPIHFHMCEDIGGREAILKDNSIHNSYARAITIHGTWGNSTTEHGVQILSNVAFDIIGHCYFLEDGAEKATILDGNLGATIKSVSGNGFATDKTGPSVFWITNPKVIMTNNVAVGAQGFGIWYVFPNEPVGPSKDLGAFGFHEARNTPLWTFDNNVVHSNVKGGMNFDNILVNENGAVTGCMNYKSVIDPFNKNSESVKVQITRLTAYKNFKINAWLRGGLFELIQYSCAESRRGLQLARGSKQHQFVTKSIIIGRSRGNYEDSTYPDAPEEVKHYLGVVFYDGPIYIEKTWFNGFQSVQDQYAAGALGFNPKNKFTSSIASNVTDLRFGFVDKVDGTGGNRVFDGTDADELLGFGNFDGDESATFRDGDGSVTGCPGLAWSRPLQVVKPEKYILTDQCQKRDNWQMVICNDNYGKLKFKVDSDFNGGNTDSFDPEAQAKRINRLDPLDVAYEDHTGMKTTEFMAILGSDKYYYQLQFVNDFPRKITVTAKGVEQDYPVVAGICLPEGLTPADVKLTAWRPPEVYTPSDGWIIVDTIEEVFADTTMTRVYMEERTLYVNFVNTFARDPHWNKWDTGNCPGGQCPSVIVEILKDDITGYTPCFTPTDEELNTDVHLDDVTSMSCELPASMPDADWGAGDTRRTAVEAEWGEWSAWSDCCGDEEKYRYRLCDDPTPLGTAASCSGDSEEREACTNPCPVDGVLTQWSRWSDCFCDGIAAGSYGAKTRTRECDGLVNGGAFCWGTMSESRPCYGNCE